MKCLSDAPAPYQPQRPGKPRNPIPILSNNGRSSTGSQARLNLPEAGRATARSLGTLAPVVGGAVSVNVRGGSRYLPERRHFHLAFDERTTCVYRRPINRLEYHFLGSALVQYTAGLAICSLAFRARPCLTAQSIKQELNNN
jgi:hypothetical protein